ncbi:MAG: Yip1 family protein [Anaerolineae bacterium]
MLPISRWLGLVGGALFLRTDAYEEIREAHSPFLTGLILIVAVGVIIALAALVGTALEWASTPNLADMRQVIYEGLTRMPWYQDNLRMVPDFDQMFRQWYDLGWTLGLSLGGGSFGSALGNLVLTPLTLVVGWLVYGLLAHLFARLLKGEATLSQTLGCTALAVAPQLLKLTELLPFVTVGGVVGTWTLICRYLALKQAHRFTWGRAFWAAILPMVTIWLVGLILVAIGILVFGTLASALLGGA